MTKDTYKGLVENKERLRAALACISDCRATLDYVDSHMAECVERADALMREALNRAYTRLHTEDIEG